MALMTRVIVITYDSGKLPNNKRTDSFQKALGYMLSYGMWNGQDKAVEYVTGYVNSQGEMDCAYWPVRILDSDTLYKDSPASIVESIHQALVIPNSPRPFVMGAVPRSDRNNPYYSFHS